jgi:hypothetical protein
MSSYHRQQDGCIMLMGDDLRPSHKGRVILDENRTDKRLKNIPKIFSLN